MQKKVLISKLVLFILVSFTCSSFPLNAQDFSKTIKKEFPLNPNGDFTLSNKYGKVEINTWNNNQVSIEVLITAHADSETDAKSIFDKIYIEFEHEAGSVSAKTSISSKSKDLMNWDKAKFTIDYKVFIPSTVTLNLSNRFGDAFVGELKNDAQVDLHHGNLRMVGVSGTLALNLSYGDVSIVEAKDLNALLRYCKARLSDIHKGEIVSKYSKIYLESAESLICSSKYDTYEIGEVKVLKNEGKFDHFTIDQAHQITAQTRYSDYVIGSLSNQLVLDLSYGGAEIANIETAFSKVDIKGMYADFNIKVRRDLAFRLSATGHNAGIELPDGFRVTYEESSGDQKEMEGYMNSGSAKGFIKTRLENGGLKVKY